jgi:hypothetical protein
MNTAIKSNHSEKGRKTSSLHRIYAMTACFLAILIFGNLTEIPASEDINTGTRVNRPTFENIIGMPLDGLANMAHGSGTDEGVELMVLCGIAFLICTEKKEYSDNLSRTD